MPCCAGIYTTDGTGPVRETPFPASPFSLHHLPQAAPSRCRRPFSIRLSAADSLPTHPAQSLSSIICTALFTAFSIICYQNFPKSTGFSPALFLPAANTAFCKISSDRNSKRQTIQRIFRALDFLPHTRKSAPILQAGYQEIVGPAQISGGKVKAWIFQSSAAVIRLSLHSISAQFPLCNLQKRGSAPCGFPLRGLTVFQQASSIFQTSSEGGNLTCAVAYLICPADIFLQALTLADKAQ